MQNDPEFDTKLEQALASYADPRDAGDAYALTTRVLASIGTQPQRHWRFSLVFAAPVLACVLLVVLVVHHSSRPVSQPVPVFHAALPVAPPVEVPHVERVRLSARRSEVKRLPKLDQFPAPTPLTEQEQLLIQFAAQAPLNIRQQIAKTQQEADGPLRIAELTIPKLDSNSQPK